MDLNDLTARFSGTAEDRRKAIFSTLFIAGNRLQTLFDRRIPEVSLKQFLLLSLVRQSEEPLTLTRLGELLGCSRQNAKKLAGALAKKGFVTVRRSPRDARAVCAALTEKGRDYFETDFSVYREELRYLFAVYTEGEVETLFTLLSRLYAGIENLEKRTAAAENQGGADT